MRSPSDKARPSDLLVDGQPIECPDGILAVLFKPAGYICTHKEGEGLTIYDLVPSRWLRRNPPVTSVGRLDKDTTGVLLLTDQGEFVHRWTSPRYEVAKVYEVTVDGQLVPELVEIFASGALQLEGEAKACLPAKLEIVSNHKARLELTEGRYHQVKRMFASQGLTVTRLHRSRFGEFDVNGLAEGQWRLVPYPA